MKHKTNFITTLMAIEEIRNWKAGCEFATFHMEVGNNYLRLYEEGDTSEDITAYELTNSLAIREFACERMMESTQVIKINIASKTITLQAYHNRQVTVPVGNITLNLVEIIHFESGYQYGYARVSLKYFKTLSDLARAYRDLEKFVDE